jgi:ribosomal protein S18 acetylase RimI-like enzyme
MRRAALEGLLYSPATPNQDEHWFGLVNSIAPATQRLVYGCDEVREALMRRAYRCNLGYFGHGRHRMAMLDMVCVGMVAACTRKETLRLGVNMLRLLFSSYPPIQALQRLRRLLASTAANPRLPPETYFLYNLAVAPAFYGQGIGSWLLEQEIDRARQQGFRAIELDVETHNAHAIVLYQRHGFQVRQHLRNQRRLDGFVFCDLLRMRFHI